MENKNYVSYEDFGAIGDGVHDDMPAIVAAHDYANEKGLPVRANDNASYFIGGKNLTATIKTSTNFGKAKFTICDLELENVGADIFQVISDFEAVPFKLDKLSHNQKKVDFPHEGTVYARVYNDDKKVYIRKGLNQNSGNAASDCFIVDGEGNVLTDINWDYDKITRAYYFCVDDKPVVIEGGVFTTIANQWESKYKYHARGMRIKRSNVTVRNLTHYVEGELDHGAPYSGMLRVEESNNVLLENCLLTPHKTYYTESQIPGKMVGMGTYDLGFGGSINTTVRGIKQTRDIRDGNYWGLMGSNFCKNFVLEDCEVSRFDAHCGVTNGAIINCKLGFAGINLIGFGEFTIKNTTVFRNNFVNFRTDYGSFFHGTLNIIDCTWVPSNKEADTFFYAYNTGDHDFGYECGVPENVNIENLTIEDFEDSEGYINLYSDYDANYAPGKPYAYGTTKNLKLENVKSKSGREIRVSSRPEQHPYLCK